MTISISVASLGTWIFNDGVSLTSSTTAARAARLALLLPINARLAGLSVSVRKKWLVKSSDPAGYIPNICWRNIKKRLYWDAHDCSSTHLFGWRNMIKPIRTGCSSTHWGLGELGAMMILAGHSYVIQCACPTSLVLVAKKTSPLLGALNNLNTPFSVAHLWQRSQYL